MAVCSTAAHACSPIASSRLRSTSRSMGSIASRSRSTLRRALGTVIERQRQRGVRSTAHASRRAGPRCGVGRRRPAPAVERGPGAGRGPSWTATRWRLPSPRPTRTGRLPAVGAGVPGRGRRSGARVEGGLDGPADADGPQADQLDRRAEHDRALAVALGVLGAEVVQQPLEGRCVERVRRQWAWLSSKICLPNRRSASNCDRPVGRRRRRRRPRSLVDLGRQLVHQLLRPAPVSTGHGRQHGADPLAAHVGGGRAERREHRGQLGHEHPRGRRWPRRCRR